MTEGSEVSGWLMYTLSGVGGEKYPRVAERLGFKSTPGQPSLRQTTSLLKNLLTAKATQPQAGLLLGAKASGSTQVLVGFLACTGTHTHTHTHHHHHHLGLLQNVP